jgi:5'-3' exonuclease
MRVHLVDGTFELFRAFYGAPAAKAADGVTEVGAARGLLRSLVALLRQDDVTHVGIAFDHVIESFRNQLFAGYKTGEGIDPALRAQFGLAERVAVALGLATWPMVELEADDALASAAHRATRWPEVEQVILCSPDKDLCQCVSGQRVVTYDRIRRTLTDEAGVVARFGVEPASIPDWLALVGDAADGIPGVPRWGKSSAGKLLGHYRHIAAIPADEREWAVAVRGAAGLAASLRDHRAEADLYRTLATLRTDAPVAESLSALRWRGAWREALRELAIELGDERLIDRVPAWQPA